MKKNIEILNYNTKVYESKYISNIHRNSFSLNKNFPLSPGKINNPWYYSLGESKLGRNPIVNPGNICLSPTFTNYNKRKSEFTPS